MSLAFTYVGRLAPSPTGLLHLGHARTFLLAHQRSREAGGTLYLRDDDLDAARVRLGYDDAMRDDMCWLGLDWDAEARQSERMPLYRAALEQLRAQGLAYPCTCSRRDLAQSIAAPHEDQPVAESDDEPLYSNRCRPTTAEPVSLAPTAANYRFRTPENETFAFIDGNAGPQAFTAGVDFGDFVIWRKDGLPSYQLACVVDDAAMGITEVVRGRDLLKSTARQIVLQRALGLPTPRYFHTDLLRDLHGVRLAKRHDALALRTLRERGLSSDAVCALALGGYRAGDPPIL